MSVRQRVRSKKHRRAALDSEDDDGNGYGEYDQEQQQRRANVAPQHRRLRQSEALRYEDEGDDSDVKIEPVAYPVHSKSSSRQRKKQSRESSSNSHTSSPVKKKSRRPMPIAVTGPMFQHEAMMATASSIAASPRVLPVMLTIGDWLDVMDYVGVWNVGQVLSIPSNDTVEVRYDGWGREYNEVVPLNSSRVAPFHTFTWSVKCWAKYLNWPWWPAIMMVRTPGNEKGVKNLRVVERVYVDFVDSKKFATRCRCWVDKRDVVPFDESFEQLRKKTNGAAFEFSLTHVLKSTATAKFPTFVQGTLPKQYESSVTMPVRKMKKVMGNAMWLKDFANNRERHNRMHGCQGALLGTQEGIDEVAVILSLQEELTRQLKERKRKKKVSQTPTRRRTQDGEDPRSPHFASQRSPRPSPRPNPRVVPNTVKNIVFPKNVILNSDDIIVEDDDDDEHEEKRSKRVKQRQRRSRSRSTTPNRVRRRSLNDRNDRDESDASSENESESEESESNDAGPAMSPPRRAAASVVREIAAKERNDPKKQQLPTTSTSKRPRAVRSLWSNDLVQDMKNEPDDAGASSSRSTEYEDASGQNTSNSSNDSEGDEDYGFTTEEYSEERLLDGNAANENITTRVPVVPATPAPPPTSVPDIEVEDKVEVKPEVTSWTQKQEPIIIDSSPETTKQEPTRSKNPAAAQKAAATPVIVPANAKEKSPPRKRPSPAPRAKAMQTMKRKPPRTLMDTRMEQAQAAIRALDEEEKQKRQDTLSSVAERRSLGNLRRVKAATGFGLPDKGSTTQQQQPELSDGSGDDTEDSQGSIVFPGLSDPPPANMNNAKQTNTSSSDTTARTHNGKRKLTAAEEKEEPGNQATLSLSKENREKEPGDEEEKDEDVVPQLRRRFCMMRASTRVSESRAVQHKVRAFRASKNEPQMVVRAPNKFPDPLPLSQQRPGASILSEITLPVFDASGELSHSMLRIADPAALTLSASDQFFAEPAFNSSAGFSINSWFKQTLS